TSASVDADIRNGRRRHPHRSTQMLVTVGADARNGRRGCFSHHLNTHHLNIKSHHLNISTSINNNGKVDIPSTLPLSLK
uniref:hypothetical protein n=1 Tax=Leyella stercorea TaxID=363265 RepID=UPI003FF01BF6